MLELAESCFSRGLNTTGIRRLNLGKEVSDGLKEAYKILYLRNLKLKDAINEISKKLNKISEVQILLDSIKASEEVLLGRSEKNKICFFSRGRIRRFFRSAINK